MKRKTIVGLAVAMGVTLLTAGVALAESPTLRGYLFGRDASTLTDVQKADVQTYQDKLAQLKKEFYGKMVTDGVMTQAQADAAIARVESDLASGEILDGLADEGRGRGRGLMGDPVMGLVDTAKLADEQKAELKTVTDKAVANETARLAKLVEFKVLTQAQADLQLKSLADTASRTDGGIAAFLRFGGGSGSFRAEHDGAVLTDAQKTELAVFDTNATAIRKELSDKLVSFGLLTQAQADQMAAMEENGHGGMRKGGMPGERGNAQGRGNRDGTLVKPADGTTSTSGV